MHVNGACEWGRVSFVRPLFEKDEALESKDEVLGSLRRFMSKRVAVNHSCPNEWRINVHHSIDFAF